MSVETFISVDPWAEMMSSMHLGLGWGSRKISFKILTSAEVNAFSALGQGVAFALYMLTPSLKSSILVVKSEIFAQ